MLACITVLCFAFAAYVLGEHPNRITHQHLKRQSTNLPSLSKRYPEHKITIPFDHFHNESRYEPHTNVTFENSYWLDTSYYADGGPVFVLTLGEDGEFDLPWLHSGLVQELANATGGVAVMWGQRYYAGNYAPPGVNASALFQDMYNPTNLRFMTTEQALADLAYFAQHASLPGLTDKNLTSPSTPWFVVGGSYGGVISAFTRIQYPDIFWGGLSSSGVTVPVVDFWQPFDSGRRHGPPACVDIQQRVTNIFDNIVLGHNKSAATQLRTALDAESSTSNYQLAGSLSIPFQNFISSWQPGNNFSFAGPDTWCANLTSQKVLFHTMNTAKMRDTAQQIIRNGGWGKDVDALLNPVLNWLGMAQQSLPLLAGNYPAPFDWLACNENPLVFTSYTPGTKGRPKALPLASRLLTVEQPLENCRLTYNFSKSWQPNLSYYERFGGLNLSCPRLALSSGQVDMWRGATPLAEVDSSNKPNPRIKSTGTVSEPQIIIEGGSHEYDLPGVFSNQTTSTIPPPAVKNAHQREIAVFKQWLTEWHQDHLAP